MRTESAIQLVKRIAQYAKEQTIDSGRKRYKCTIDAYHDILNGLREAEGYIIEAIKQSGYPVDDSSSHTDTSQQVFNEMMKIISTAAQAVGQTPMQPITQSTVTADEHTVTVNVNSEVSGKRIQSGLGDSGEITQSKPATPTEPQKRDKRDWGKIRRVYYEAVKKIDGITANDCQNDETLICAHYVVRWYKSVFDAVDRSKGKGHTQCSLGLGPDKIRFIVPRLVIAVCYHARMQNVPGETLDDFENMFQTWVNNLSNPDAKKYPYPREIKDMMVRTEDGLAEYIHPKYFEIGGYNADLVYKELFALGLSHASTDVQGRDHTEYLSIGEVDHLEVESSDLSSSETESTTAQHTA